jgi:hypothetical protein
MKAVTIEFTDKPLTGHAGLVHFGKFIQKLKLTELLRKHLHISRAANAEYQVAGGLFQSKKYIYNSSN